MTIRNFLWAFYAGLALGGILIIAVFMTGQTFGQRCAKIWDHGSPAWQNCVQKFADKNGMET